MEVRQKYVIWAFFLIIGLILIPENAYPQDLRLLIGSREIFVESRQHQGRTYYRLNRIADVFDLKLEEEGTNLIVRGSRGELGLSDGRPLVHSDNEYLLLSSAAWRRGVQDWYVPVDFLQKALPSILRFSLTREGVGRYRVRGLGENRVRLNSVAYPDHLSVILTPSEETESRVSDYTDYLEITFSDLLVVPLIQSQPSEKQVIVSLTFNPQIGLGSFRVEKGSSYSHFREQRMTNPNRLVLNIYPKPGYRITSAGPERGRYFDRIPQNPVIASDDPAPPVVENRKQVGVVVIDPGHGGQDRGVDIQSTQASEKTLTLQISKILEAELGKVGTACRLTRYRDVNLSIEQRSAVANYYEAKMYLGIHIGASPSSSTRGPVVYVYAPLPREEGRESDRTESRKKPGNEAGEDQQEFLTPWKQGQVDHLPESRRLARRIQSSLNRVFKLNNSITSAPLEVLAPISAPAVIIEMGQLNNSEDRELLMDPTFISQLIQALSNEVVGFNPL